jgi:hypothetical protein
MNFTYAKVVFLILIVFPNLGCNEDYKKESSKNYFEGKEQSTKTNIVDSLRHITKLKLGDLGIYKPGDIDTYGNYVYISDIQKREVYKLEKKPFQVVDTLGNGRGQGPGEAVRIRFIDIKKGKITVPDVRNRKIMIFNTNGTLEKEIKTESFPPRKAELVNEGRILVSTDARPGVSKFILLDRSGDILSSFINVKEGSNILMYNDDISVNDEKFYVTGFSEPILKKFSLNGDLVFSRHTINDISTSNSYSKLNLGDNQTRYSYSSAALYSSYGISSNDDCLFVLPVHNTNGTTRKLIDVYESEGGDYIHSYWTRGNITNLAIDQDDHVYALERINKEIFLTSYNITR